MRYVVFLVSPAGYQAAVHAMERSGSICCRVAAPLRCVVNPDVVTGAVHHTHVCLALHQVPRSASKGGVSAAQQTHCTVHRTGNDCVVDVYLQPTQYSSPHRNCILGPIHSAAVSSAQHSAAQCESLSQFALDARGGGDDLVPVVRLQTRSTNQKAAPPQTDRQTRAAHTASQQRAARQK